MPHPARFRFGDPAVHGRLGGRLGRPRPRGRGPRLLDAVHPRPLRRPALARARPHGRGGRHHRRCASAPWCSTTTTSTRSSPPRRWRPSTCSPTAGSSSASAPGGWPATTSSRASPWTTPPPASTAWRRAWPCSRACSPPVRSATRASTTRSPTSTVSRCRAAAPPAVHHRRRRAAGAGLAGARPTSWASTPPSARAGSTPPPPTTGVAAVTDRKLGWVAARPATATPTSSCRCCCSACVVTDDRAGTLDSLAPLFSQSPDELAEYPHAWVGNVDQIADDLVARRERWDVSYVVVQGADAMRAAAPVVATHGRRLSAARGDHAGRSPAPAGWPLSTAWPRRASTASRSCGSPRAPRRARAPRHAGRRRRVRLDDLPGGADAVVVATPPRLHRREAERAVDAARPPWSRRRSRPRWTTPTAS